MKKVLLILVDGMRPDAMTACGSPVTEELRRASTHCMTTRTVMPSVTLPCHMSLFHSVPPQRHGVLTNTYTPQVRPVVGLIDAVHDAGLSTAMFNSWEELRDISRPGKLDYSLMRSQYAEQDVGTRLAREAIAYCEEKSPDFVFLYLGEPDEVGHHYGWMTPEYLESIRVALASVKEVKDALGEEYTVFLTADHGGHERSHGSEMPEDMTIPLFICGEDTEAGKELPQASILDIAPTIAGLLGVRTPRDWEGQNLL